MSGEIKFRGRDDTFLAETYERTAGWVRATGCTCHMTGPEGARFRRRYDRRTAEWPVGQIEEIRVLDEGLVAS
jgi:hypothetical protein